MKKDQVLLNLYSYFLEKLPPTAISLICTNDIRVENFFAIHAGVYLDQLMREGQIKTYSFQHTVLFYPNRVHIDIKFTDNDDEVTYLELKHFSISQNRGNRGLSFYTSNSIEGKKVGIIGDCEKLDNLRNNGLIDNISNLVCCAFITPKPTHNQLNNMEHRFNDFRQLIDWNLIYPIDPIEQNNNIGIITLQK